MNYVVYRLTDGSIVKTGTANARNFAIQAGEGQGVIEGKADKKTQKIVDGKVVPK